MGSMLRHSSSLFVSVMLHAALLLGVLALYRFIEMPSLSQSAKEHRVCLCLADVVHALPKVPPPIEAEPSVIPKSLPLPSTPPHEVTKTTKTVTKKSLPSKQSAPQKVIETRSIPKQAHQERVTENSVENHEDSIESLKPEEPLNEKERSPNVSHNVVQETPARTEAPVTTKSEEAIYLQEHLQVIAQLLRKHLYYPKRARKRHIEGDVVVVFELLQNGSIGSVHVKKSSHRKILDRAAVKTIGKLSGKVPKPSQTIRIEIPITFRLRS